MHTPTPVGLRELRAAWHHVREALGRRPFEQSQAYRDPVGLFRRFGYELLPDARRALESALP